MPMVMELHCRDELRAARAAVLRDTEAFAEILFAIERTGAALIGRAGTLTDYRSELMRLGGRSALGNRKRGGVDLGNLFEVVRDGRNEALHQGAYARHLAYRAV